MKISDKSTVASGIYGAITVISFVFALQMAAKIVNLWFFEPLPASGILSNPENFIKFKFIFLLAGACGVGGSFIAFIWVFLRRAPVFFSVLLLLILWGAVGGIGVLTFLATASPQGGHSVYTDNYPLFETFLNSAAAQCVCFFALPIFAFLRKPKKENKEKATAGQTQIPTAAQAPVSAPVNMDDGMTLNKTRPPVTQNSLNFTDNDL